MSLKQSTNSTASAVPTTTAAAPTTTAASVKHRKVKFNIYKFFNYYKNPKNYSVDTTQNIMINHYAINKHSVYALHTEPLTQKYITISGEIIYINYYIGRHNMEHILFTIPKQDKNGIWWDDHFHFGIEKKYTSRRITRKNNGTEHIKAIFFHKTEQTGRGAPKKTHCSFEQKLDLNSIDIRDIKCESHDYHKMENKFPVGSKDFNRLYEIIRRPFFGPHHPGGLGGAYRERLNRTCKNRRQRTRKIRRL